MSRLFILLFTLAPLLSPCSAMDRENEEERTKTQRLQKLETQLQEIKALKEKEQSRSNYRCNIIVVLGTPNPNPRAGYDEFKPYHPDEIWLYIDSKIGTHRTDRARDYFLQASVNEPEDLAMLVKYLHHIVYRLIIDSSYFKSSESTLCDPKQLFSMISAYGRLWFVPSIQVCTEQSIAPAQHFSLQYSVYLPKESYIEYEKDKKNLELYSYFEKSGSYIRAFLNQYFKKVVRCHSWNKLFPDYLAEDFRS